MSSCRTAPTSTTASSTSLPSRTELPVVIACGALGGHIREIAARHGWQIELHCLPALLHNRTCQITIHPERIARRGIALRGRVTAAPAQSVTNTALVDMCARLGPLQLARLHIPKPLV